MPARLLRRLAATLLLVVGVSSAAFLVTHLAPGDVVQTTMGFGASQATIARAQHPRGPGSAARRAVGARGWREWRGSTSALRRCISARSARSWPSAR
jgi:hypothetical protein